MWADKFAFISPVWLQIKKELEGKYVVTGQHDIDKKWVETLRKSKGILNIN